MVILIMYHTTQGSCFFEYALSALRDLADVLSRIYIMYYQIADVLSVKH